VSNNIAWNQYKTVNWYWSSEWKC